MSWIDRLQEAAYISPSGVRIVFNYENVKRAVSKKTTGFEFPDADGTFVQDLGRSGRRYPMMVIFWGNDYDQQASSFEAALIERGIGKLEHPLYGTIDVVPFGTITRRDDLKTASNQAFINVSFWETIGLTYPATQTDPGNEILAAIQDYNTSASIAFGESISLDTTVEQVTFENTYQAISDVSVNVLQPIADTQSNIKSSFDVIKDSIDNSIDQLIKEPIILALQTIQLIQTPARALTNITARLVAYGNLITSIVSGKQSIAKPGFDSKNFNDFYTRDLYGSTYVTGSILSTINNTFFTKPEAIAAAEVILNQMDAIINWRDLNYKSLNDSDFRAAIDTGDAYQKLQEAVALTAGFLIEISFSLKQEWTIILDRDRTIVDLTAELYGEIDGKLDFLIDSNNLSGSEIIEIPRGRAIVYYV